RAIVPVLAEHGARVAVNDVLAADAADQVLAEIGASGDNVAYFQADTTQPGEVDAMFEQIERTWTLPDTVCCHAGMVEAYPVTQYPLDGFDRLLDVNLRAAFIVAQEAAQRWQSTDLPGHLIFTTSWVQDVPWPEITPYNVSKAGLRMMMRGFA